MCSCADVYFAVYAVVVLAQIGEGGIVRRLGEAFPSLGG